MLLPQMIDSINRHNVAAIQQLERHAAQLNRLQDLLTTMSAAVKNFEPMTGGGFLMHVATPVYWLNPPTELAALLHDYDITWPLQGTNALLRTRRSLNLNRAATKPATSNKP